MSFYVLVSDLLDFGFQHPCFFIVCPEIRKYIYMIESRGLLIIINSTSELLEDPLQLLCIELGLVLASQSAVSMSGSPPEAPAKQLLKNSCMGDSFLSVCALG